jgi:hypothetical protein
VWSANPDWAVGEGATTQVTMSSNLVLKSTDGKAVWSTGASAVN